MINFFKFRRNFSLVILLMLSGLLNGKVSFIPDPPNLSAENFLLIDVTTQRVLAEKNADKRIEPASITKLMAGYVIADQIDKGFINEQDEVLISENCWKKTGSRMFIEAGKKVLVDDLLKGMIIQSGNDATCALAEHVAGSEENFIDLMRAYVIEMGLLETNFVNATGWPDTNHYSTARDLVKISSRLILDFPSHYALYKEKWFTYNEIKQRNRNSLLWQDDSIDGIKTGKTDSAGYCLVTSAKRGDTRIIAITIKSDNERTRTTDNRRLLDYGFRYFQTRKILSSTQPLIDETVWGGEVEKVSLFSKEDIYLTQSPRDFERINIITNLDDYIQAPIYKGDKVGSVIIELDGIELYKEDLVSNSIIDSRGFFGRVWSNLQLIVYGFLMEDE
tara:strand:+ start:19601 stop:20773 length:1173 start_codon:yes stop_codon:yes gene_type:complete